MQESERHGVTVIYHNDKIACEPLVIAPLTTRGWMDLSRFERFFKSASVIRAANVRKVSSIYMLNQN